MLNAFEQRIIELLSDGLSELGELDEVLRPHDGVSAAKGDEVQVFVRLLEARPLARVGDDERERLGEPGAWRRRVSLRLGGAVELRFVIGEASKPADRQAQRRRLLGVVDRALIVLADEELRSGKAFASDEDLGFELDGFRLEQLGLSPEHLATPDLAAASRILSLRVNFEGRFWPVGEEQAGVSITELPIRDAVLPAGLPSRVRVRAGETVDIGVDLALELLVSTGEGSEGEPPEPRIMARLLGASPGELLGEAAAGTTDWIAYLPGPESRGSARRYTLRYRAPESVSGTLRARVALAFARELGGRVDLGTVVVEVRE